MEFTPKLFTLLRQGISKAQISKDVLSGIVVGIVALPLAIAFAIASGVPPDKGLITAIVAGLIISVFGGSRVQIGGPTGAFIVIVYAIVQEHGVAGLTIATFMAGVLIILMGLIKLGNLLKFFPYPLIVGFTSGIALIIFSSQVNDFLGLRIETVPADFIEKWKAYFLNFTHINGYSLAIAATTVLITFNFHRISTKIPGSIVAILAGTLAAWLLKLPVDTIATRFGDIPRGISLPTFPKVDFATIQTLIQPALAIALLGAIESLLSAVVADGMIGGKHRSNIELIAQGAANIFSALFGGIPATGAIARTATNIKNGGRTPIAGITHAITLLLIMLLLAPYAKYIPMAVLAGILVVVAYNMGEWHHFARILKTNRLDATILLTTFILTVLFDLIVAIEVGVVLSSFIFMKRMSEVLTVKNLDAAISNQEHREQLFEEELPSLPAEIALYEINGPLFFGAAQQFQESISNIHHKPRILILRMRHVPFVDATGLQRLQEVVKNFQQRKVVVILSGVNQDVKKAIEKSPLALMIGTGYICENITVAMEKAKEVLDSK